jgi:seryl-tRNA synthetase
MRGNKLMIKSIIQLEHDFERLQQQRARLQADFNETNAHVIQARAQLINGGGKKDIDASTVLMARETSLSAALAEIDSQISFARAELETAGEHERRAAHQQRTVEIESEKTSAESDFNAAREAAALGLDEHVRAMSEAMARWNALVREAESLGHRTLSRFQARDIPPYDAAVGFAFAAFLGEHERVAAKARSQQASARAREREKRLAATT